jgi:hypothetical protein
MHNAMIDSYPTDNLSNIKCYLPFLSNGDDIRFSLDDRRYMSTRREGHLSATPCSLSMFMSVTVLQRLSSLQLQKETLLLLVRDMNLQIRYREITKEKGS